MFTGVNEGYQGESIPVTDLGKAVRIATESLNAAKRLAGDANTYDVKPGVVIYSPTRGCPIGGEPVAVISTTGDNSFTLRTAENLRQKLKQTTWSVGTYSPIIGTPTIGFTAVANYDLKVLATTWQEIAEKCNSAIGLYISTGIYDNGNNRLIISAEANPQFFKDTKLWQQTAEALVNSLNKKLGITITLSYREAGYNYLREVQKSL